MENGKLILFSVMVFVSALSYVAPSQAAALNDSYTESIRVRISKLKNDSVSFTGLGLRFPGQPQSQPGYRAYTIKWLKPLAPGLPTTWVVSDRDRGNEIARVKTRAFTIQGESIRVGLRSVPDRIALVPTDSSAKSMDVVATLDLEDYLRGVLPSEMPASWPLEALKAQAVAARTFALFRKSQKSNSFSNYDVESDVMDQVFRNPLADDARSVRIANVERALRETRSLVLLDPRHEAFQAYFHADCGGRTEEARAVWGGGEVLGTAVDGACPLNPKAKWVATYSAAELERKLQKLSRGRDAGASRLTDIAILARTKSGRIDSLKLSFSDGRVATLSGHAFRMAVGFDQVKSTQFTVKRNGQAFELAGVGYGHGVGLCQWGAKQMARVGKTYQEILSHYYPKAKLERAGEIGAAPEIASLTSPRKL
jgi:stage II sporulation protein D